MTPRRHNRSGKRSGLKRSALPLRLYNRISGIGMVIALLTALTLCAIVEQQMATGRKYPKAVQPKVTITPTPTPTRTKVPRHRRSPAAIGVLEKQVERVTLARRGDAARRAYAVTSLAAPMVRVSGVDKSKTWAMGTSTISPPRGVSALPEVSMFVAHAAGTAWDVRVTGTKEFTKLIAKAPAALVPGTTRASLTQFDGAVDPAQAVDTGLMLPWRPSQAWAMAPITGAPETEVGFQGGDGQVRASGDGLFYRLCSSAPDRGLIMIVHSNGLASEYYQLSDTAKLKDGDTVKRGDYLGKVSTDEPCTGEQAPDAALHFGLRSGQQAIPFNGVRLGGWVFRQAGDALSAEHGGQRVTPGFPMPNYGVTTPKKPSPGPSKTDPSKTDPSKTDPSKTSPSKTKPSPKVSTKADKADLVVTVPNELARTAMEVR